MSSAAQLVDKTVPIPDYPGQYVIALDVFHQLHCLVSPSSHLVIFSCACDPHQTQTEHDPTQNVGLRVPRLYQPHHRREHAGNRSRRPLSRLGATERDVSCGHCAHNVDMGGGGARLEGRSNESSYVPGFRGHSDVGERASYGEI